MAHSRRFHAQTDAGAAPWSALDPEIPAKAPCPILQVAQSAASGRGGGVESPSIICDLQEEKAPVVPDRNADGTGLRMAGNVVDALLVEEEDISLEIEVDGAGQS